jgi:hypothetical protein
VAGTIKSEAQDLRCPVLSGGAGDRDRIRTVSLGIRPIGACDRPELGSRCTAGDRHGPCDTRANGPPMGHGTMALDAAAVWRASPSLRLTRRLVLGVGVVKVPGSLAVLGTAAAVVPVLAGAPDIDQFDDIGVHRP